MELNEANSRKRSAGGSSRGAYLHHDMSFLTPLDDIRSGKPRVKFNLVHAQNPAFALPLLRVGLLDVRFEFFEMVDTIIRHTNRPHFAVLDRLDQCLPGS